jgi:hypothetical protein
MPAKDTEDDSDVTQKLPKVEAGPRVKERLEEIRVHLHAHGNANVVEIREGLIRLLDLLITLEGGK